MSTMNSSFHPWIISGVGPWEMVPASCCVIVGLTEFTLDDGADVVVVWIKEGVAPGKKSSKAQGGRRGHFWINSRTCRWRNRGRAPCERSCETSWRSTRSWGGSRQRSRLVYTDQGRGNRGAPSGPHPGRWRSHVTGSGKRHPDPGVWGLGLGSPGRVLEPGEGRGEASSGRRRRHRRTGRDCRDRLRGMYGKRRHITPYTCHEVLVRLCRGRRRREVIQEAWRKRRTVLGHRWSRLRRGRDRRNRPWRNRHDSGWRARHYWSLSWWRSWRTLGGRGQIRNRTTQARRGRWFVLTITPQVIHAEKQRKTWSKNGDTSQMNKEICKTR